MNNNRRARGLVSAIRNAGRFREILSVFVKNGFEEFVIKSKMHEFIPDFVFPAAKKEKILANYDAQDQWWGTVGHRLRLCFEELGPVFVKFGQLLSTREDFFDAAFTAEMRKLQDEVKGLSLSQAKEVMEKSWGKKIQDVCAEIGEGAVASASIASVFKATLSTGEQVVIKVKRPGIEHTLESDFQLLSVLVETLENSSEQFRWMAISRTLDEFHRVMKMEMNLTHELVNLERLRTNQSNVSSSAILVLPKPYPHLCSKDVLVMEYFDGIPFSKLGPADVTPDLRAKLLQCVQLFMHSLLRDGFFHADLHGGNFFLLKDGRIGVVDFGLVGTLSKKNRTIFLSILYNLVTGDFDRLVYELLDVAEYEKIPDYQVLARDLEIALAPLLVLSASQIPSAELLRELIGLLAKHRLYLPREWSVIFRALITLDGVGRSLGIDIQTFDVLDKSTKEFASMVLNKDEVLTQSLWFLKDSLSSFRMLPKHFSWFMREFSKNGYSLDVRVPELTSNFLGLTRSFHFIGFVMLVCTFLTLGTLFIPQRDNFSWSAIPSITMIFWSISLILLILAVWRIRPRK